MPKHKLTEKLLNEALLLAENGATNADLIQYLGIAETTFYKWLREPQTELQEQLSQGLKKADVKRKLWHLQRIQNAAENGSWQASAWYLERRYPKEFARPALRAVDANTEETGDNLVEAMGATAKEDWGGYAD